MSDLVANKVYKGINEIRDKVCFKLARNAIANYIEAKNITDVSVVDIGCATGDFLILCNDAFDINCQGIDVDHELLEIANKRSNRNITFTKANFWYDAVKLPQKPFKVYTCFAVSGYFEDEEVFLKKFLDNLDNDDLLIIQGLFNLNGLTVKLEWKKDEEFQPGMNQLNLEKCLRIINEYGFNVETERVKVTDNIAFNSDFPHRAFSIDHPDFSLMNGANLLLSDYILRIQK